VHAASANTSVNFAANQTRFLKTDAGKANKIRYNTSRKGKVSRKRYEDSTKGSASMKRGGANRRARRRQSAAMRLDYALAGVASNLISGRSCTSPKFVKHAGVSAATFIAHMKRSCKQRGFQWDDYGITWELDHKIPREAFDFDDPTDVRRAWSLSNAHALSKQDNREKSWKLVDNWVSDAGVACFPVAWNGQPPTEEMKKAHQETCLAQKLLGEGSSA
jgi:5-methylcytosine-specific restriction endonuclease McrA